MALKWHTIPVTMFPANVKMQTLVDNAIKAKSELTKAVLAFADRISVDGIPVVQDGESLVVGLKWGKLSVASAAPRASSPKSKVSIA